MSNPQTAPTFTKIEDAHVVLVQKGIYRQADLYELGTDLYAKVRDGFVALKAIQLTSSPQIKWTSLYGIDFIVNYDGPKRVKPAAANRTRKRKAA